MFVIFDKIKVQLSCRPKLVLKVDLFSTVCSNLCCYYISLLSKVWLLLFR